MGIKMYANNKAKLNLIYRATEKHIDDNALPIASTPAFQTAFNKFNANIATNTTHQKSAALTGIAVDRNNSKMDKLVELFREDNADFVKTYEHH